MNRNSKVCQGAADKVKELLSKEGLIESGSIKKVIAKKLSEHRQCNRIKTFRMPSKKDHLNYAAGKDKPAKEKLANLLSKASLVHLEEGACSKLNKEALHTSQCSTSERHRIMNLEQLKSSLQSQLHSHHFTRWQFRELKHVQNRLKAQKKHNFSQTAKRHEIKCLSSEQKDAEEEAQKQNKEQWEELIKLKEERHFNIGRITKHFIH